MGHWTASKKKIEINIYNIYLSIYNLLKNSCNIRLHGVNNFFILLSFYDLNYPRR